MRIKTDSAGVPYFSGWKAWELWSTHGLPVEIADDVARERGWAGVDMDGFRAARAYARWKSERRRNTRRD